MPKTTTSKKNKLVLQTRHWPILYKTSTSNGKVTQWQIWVEGSVIHTESGYVGQKLTSTSDPIYKGKNIGRSNETTPEEQAELEAASKYQKYLDRGYATKDGPSKKDEVIFPMLAHEWDKHQHKVSYPVIVQPKLDGVRMIASYGKSFMSRRGKTLAVPKQVQDDLREIFGDLIVDGELYNHEYRSEFSKIISATRTVKGEAENLHLIQYHIYDIVTDASYEDRRELIKERMYGYTGSSLVRVKSFNCGELDEVERRYDKLLEAGYEGAMIRVPNSTYQIDKRSYGLLKYKPVYSGEFKIVGIVEGRGRLKGHVGTFTCEMNDQYGKRTFETVLKGSGVTEFLKEAFTKHSLWKDKLMVVEHLGLTDAEKKPRHPRGVKIIDRDMD